MLISDLINELSIVRRAVKHKDPQPRRTSGKIFKVCEALLFTARREALEPMALVVKKGKKGFASSLTWIVPIQDFKSGSWTKGTRGSNPLDRVYRIVPH